MLEISLFIRTISLASSFVSDETPFSRLFMNIGAFLMSIAMSRYKFTFFFDLREKVLFLDPRATRCLLFANSPSLFGEIQGAG